MVHNGYMAAPEQVDISTKNDQHTMDTPSKKNFYKEEGGQIFDDEGDDDQEKGEEIGDN